MKTGLILLGALLAAAAPAAGVAQPSAAAPVWTQQVQRTAESGWRVGNPDAPVKLIEYGSVTCSHCADFAEAARGWLPDLVRSGRVSFEYRPLAIFPSDPGIFMLLACQEPNRFFRTLDQLYATQSQWTGRLEAMTTRQIATIDAMPAARRPGALVRAAGVDQHFRQGGLSQRRIDACLIDPAESRRIAASGETAGRMGVAGTPTFFVNGREAKIGGWDDLRNLLTQQ